MAEVISLFVTIEALLIIMLLLVVILFIRSQSKCNHNVRKDVQKIKEQIMEI